MSSKDTSQPLQTLSPERVNGTRLISTTSTISSKSTKSSDVESQDLFFSQETSPTRRAKANLFADYDPSRNTPRSPNAFALPQSPSLPEFTALKSHVRQSSDVQGLVKRFEHLDVRDRDADYAERRKRHEAELRRAQIAREEAESDVRRLREEVRHLKQEGEEGRERERKVAKRLDVLMEEQLAAKESTSSQSNIYEKELRRARKEAFKSSSAVLKLQEELKGTRNTLRVTQSTHDLDKQKLEQKEQERFEMEYQLIPLAEQVEKLTRKLQVAESEKDALKTTMKEEEVARIAAEGLIALPASQEQDDDLLSSPRKQSPVKRIPSPLSDDKENIGAPPKKMSENKSLADELEREKVRRMHAEELTEFMRIECMFRCCKCHSASRLGHELGLSLDTELAAGVDRIRAGMEGILTPPASSDGQDRMDVEEVKLEDVNAGAEDWIQTEPAVEEMAIEPSEYATAHDMDRSLTMQAESPKPYPSPDDQLRGEAEEAMHAETPTPAQTEHEIEAVPMNAVDDAPQQPSTPQTASHNDHDNRSFRPHPLIRTVTTTTTVPTHFTPMAKPPLHPSLTAPAGSAIWDDDEPAVPVTPRTFDREAALAAIEYRRGRAKSIANGHVTPRKQMLEGVNVKERRDISAPALGAKAASPVKSVMGGSLGRSARKA